MIQQQWNRWLLLWLFVWGLTGCQAQSENDLKAKVQAHIAATQTATNQALAHWDALILGQSVSCQVGLAVPAPLLLSSEQLEMAPATVSIQMALNQAIEQLTISASVWANLCQSEAVMVSPEAVNTGYLAAQAAQIALTQAQTQQTMWIP